MATRRRFNRLPSIVRPRSSTAPANVYNADGTRCPLLRPPADSLGIDRKFVRIRDLPRDIQQRIRRWTVVVLALVAIAALGAWFLQSTIPRHIVLASGLEDGMYHQFAQRYKAILARDGVTVEERLTGGADENERLLHDPHPASTSHSCTAASSGRQIAAT